jgi:hypothetical protein
VRKAPSVGKVDPYDKRGSQVTNGEHALRLGLLPSELKPQMVHIQMGDTTQKSTTRYELDPWRVTVNLQALERICNVHADAGELWHEIRRIDYDEDNQSYDTAGVVAEYNTVDEANHVMDELAGDEEGNREYVWVECKVMRRLRVNRTPDQEVAERGQG